MRETRDLREGSETGIKVGEISWAFGTPVVAVRDVYIPERIDAWGYFPGKPDQPILRMTLEVRQGIPSFTRIEIVAASDGVEIAASHIGLVRDNLEWWRDMIARNSAQKSAERVKVGTAGWDTITAPDWAEADTADAVAKQVRRGPGARRKATDARHERVATIYRAHIDGKPLAALRDAFRGPSGEPISRRTAARYAKEAEEAGYLPPTTQGKKRV